MTFLGIFPENLYFCTMRPSNDDAITLKTWKLLSNHYAITLKTWKLLSNHLLSSCIWYEGVIISFWWVFGRFMHFGIMTSPWRHRSKCWPHIKMARGLKCSGGYIVPINAKTWNCTWNYPVRPTSYRLLVVLFFISFVYFIYV